MSCAILSVPSLALGAGGGAGDDAHLSTTLLLMFAVLLLAGKIGGIVEKFGIPSVLGELSAGIFLSWV